MKKRSASSRSGGRVIRKKRAITKRAPALSVEEFDRLADLPADDPAGDLTPHLDWSKARRPARAAKNARSTIVRHRLTSTRLARQAALQPIPHVPDAAIDFSDIPEATREQLAQFRRASLGRPPIGSATRQAISIRLDPAVLRELRAEATRRGVGYQTLLNDVLAGAVLRFRQDRKAHR
jgi:uncharacterized protein (DUF4415 family)